MKFFVILNIFIILYSIPTEQKQQIFSLNLENGINQFEQFQITTPITQIAQVEVDDDNSVITFQNLTKYSGIITKKWINSTNGNYWIVVEFKGEANKQTGGYIGYMRSDNQNIYKTIGLNAQYNMDLYQIYRFNSTGSWNTYSAYITLPQGVAIKIILEQGSYFGIKTQYKAEFKSLAVWNFTFLDECPGIDKQEKLAYFAFLFSNMELKNKIFAESLLESKSNSKGTLKFSFPFFATPCINTAFYGFDSEEKVIESFEPQYQLVTDLYSSNVDQLNTYTYSFSMSDIEKLGCKSTQISCIQDGNTATCKKYTCPIAFHFYYDNGDNKQFNNKQDKYDYTKNNSQAIFNSSFSVIVYKEEVVNTYLKTADIDSVCTGVCIMDTELDLKVSMKVSEDNQFLAYSNEIIFTADLGDFMYFQITSDQADYEFKLIKIFVTKETEINELGTDFIKHYIEITKTSTGLLEFKMQLSGEAAIEKGYIIQSQIISQLGSKFSIFFLIEANQGRLLQSSASLPNAAITSSNSFTVSNIYAATFRKLYFGIAILILLFIH